MLKPWSDMHQRFPLLTELPTRQQKLPIVPQIYQYLAAMQESLELLVQANRTGDEDLRRRANEMLQKAAAGNS